MIVYLNGEFVPKEEAKVSVFDHGYLYGDGAFEGIRAYDGKVFRLHEHIGRLYKSARAIMLKMPMPPAEMAEVVLETLRRNKRRDGYIRVVVSRGEGDLGLNPDLCPRPTVVVIADDITLFPARDYEEGLTVVTVSTRRNIPEALDPKIKSLNYLNNILAKIETNLAGVKEGIMLNREGYCAEGTGDNLFIVSEGAILTPPPHAGILVGITRQVVIEIAQRLGLPCREELITQHEVYTAEECFLTGTAAEIIPVVKMDGRIIGTGRRGPVTEKLQAHFRELTRSEGVPIYPG